MVNDVKDKRSEVKRKKKKKKGGKGVTLLANKVNRREHAHVNMQAPLV